MTGFLTSGLSALIGTRAALDITGQNIANVNTPGYSRQRVDFAPQQVQRTIGSSFGNGVTVEGLERFTNSFVFDTVVDGSSGSGRLSTLSDYSNRINNLLADPQLGVGPTIQQFFDALQDATADPASTELRQVVLGQAEALANRFNRVGGEIAEIGNEIDRNLAATVDEINALTAEIADLNVRIVGTNNAPIAPNDLLDQRDLALTQLAELIGIETVEDSDGAVNVVALPGYSLVTGAGANTLAVEADPLDASRLRVELRSGVTGSQAPIDPTSGQLGGLIDARTDLVDRSLDQLGRTAFALATTINAQSAEGLDLNGAFGGDVFSLTGAPDARPATSNVGTGNVAVTVSDLGALTGDSYELLYDGTGYQALRQSDGAVVTLTGTGTGADPLVFDGLSLVVSGTPTAGDRFAVEPTRGAANGIRLALTDTDGLAFAAPVSASAALTNVGNGSIEINRTTDVTDPNLLATSTIEFLDANTYQVNGAGTFAYVSGDPIVLNGIEFTISGAPTAGDQFTLSANTNAPGDNRNALLFAGQRDAGILDGGRSGLVASYGQIVTDSGVRTRNLQASIEAQDALLEAAVREQQAVSGVDLDEEAANLVRFQQAYQAATQLVAIANSLFDELIGAVRR
ncbi:MAG: flagellar hook-associated protein FlgK [Pseudomonadota bacterium]